MTIVRIGATKKYSDGWESAFAKGKKKSVETASPKKKPAAKKLVKTSAKKAKKK